MASPETDVYDVFGKHIIPSYIAPITRIGLVEVGLVRQSVDYAERGSINPNVKANVSYHPDSELITLLMMLLEQPLRPKWNLKSEA